MGIFGWDLPPGVSTRDLPGNSPEDEAAEAFYDGLYNNFPEGYSEEDMEKIIEKLGAWAWDQVGKAFSDGYSQGAADAGQALEAGYAP